MTQSRININVQHHNNLQIKLRRVKTRKNVTKQNFEKVILNAHASLLNDLKLHYKIRENEKNNDKLFYDDLESLIFDAQTSFHEIR